MKPSTSGRRSRLASAALITAACVAAAAPAETLAAQNPAATCDNQALSQPFAAFSDTNLYTPAPDGNFDNPFATGWQLSGGARVISTTRPDGSIGGALDLPSGAVAISPPVCVTLAFPTARTWVRDVVGSEGVQVGVSYAGTKTAANAKTTGQVHGQHANWTLSDPFNVQPQIAGKADSQRQVQFVFTAGGKTSDFQLFDIEIDPRMRH